MQYLRNSLCLVLLAGIASAHADSVTLVSVADNTLYESETGSLSNGAGSAMFAGVNVLPPTTIRRCIFRFDIASSIPAGSTITSAALSLTQTGSNADPQPCSLHLLLASWGEGTSVAGSGQGGGAPPTLDDATWAHRFWSSTPWSAPGGDFASIASATTDVGGSAAFTWSSPQVTADAQFMLDNPAQDFGWLLRGNEAFAQTSKKFATREDPNPDLRPTLRIEFSLPCPGDLNNDGLVDDADFVLFAASYNLLDCTDPSMPAGCPADLNSDGFVDDSDFVLFVVAYNELICP